MNGIKWEMCECCQTEFVDKDELSEHTLREHLLYELLVNPLHHVSDEYNQLLVQEHFYENLKADMKSREKCSSFKCDLCNKNFSNKYTLKKHVQLHIHKTKNGLVGH